MVSLLFTTMLAYPMSRKDFKYSNQLSFFVFFTMLFNGGIVSSYIMWTQFFHIKNTYFALLLPNLLMNAMNIMLVRNYYKNSIPFELVEAAEIDGASKVKMFFSITVPQITPIIFFNLIMQTIQALQNFTSAFVITDGGPMKATYVLGMKLYKEGFSYFKMGYASAISWIIFIVIMLITLVLFATSKWWVFYGDES